MMNPNDKTTTPQTFGRRSLFARMAAAVVAGSGLSQVLPRAVRSLLTSNPRPVNVTIHPQAVSRSNKESSTHGA